LRSACSKAAVATKISAGSYVSIHSSKWAPTIDQQREITSGCFGASGLSPAHFE